MELIKLQKLTAEVARRYSVTSDEKDSLKAKESVNLSRFLTLLKGSLSQGLFEYKARWR